jgi:hypothetical protein
MITTVPNIPCRMVIGLIGERCNRNVEADDRVVDRALVVAAASMIEGCTDLGVITSIDVGSVQVVMVTHAPILQPILDCTIVHINSRI